MRRLGSDVSGARWGAVEVRVEKNGVSTIEAQIVSTDDPDDVLDRQFGFYVGNEFAAEIQRRWNAEPDVSALASIPGYSVFGDFILLAIGIVVGLIVFGLVILYRVYT